MVIFHHMVKMGTFWSTIMHAGKNDVLRCKSLGSGLARSCLFFPRQAAAGGLGCTAFVPVTLHKRSLLLIGT